MTLAHTSKFASVTVAALLLASCTNVSGGLTVSPSVQTSLANIGAFTLADLQSADKIALANNDKLGDACFKGIAAFVTEQQAAVGNIAGNTVSGAFSAFEQGRVAVNATNSAISKTQYQALETACAPLVQDQITDQTLFLANIASLGKL